MRYVLRTAAVCLALLAPGALRAQQAVITGTVTDENGGPLPGANVLIEQLVLGASTDVEGRYAITVPAAEVRGQTVTLTARYISYQSEERAVTLSPGTQAQDFRLRSDVLKMDEVVVTGTGTGTSRKRLGIDVSSVSADQLNPVANLSLDQALAGKVAGAHITQTGLPGAPSAIILRGINTLGSTRPMILVDGVEVDASTLANGSNAGSSRLADIDFNDIERVEVIKGAAAATLYGAQGANGVIQLFTKRGQAGRPVVSVTSGLGYSEFLRGGVEFATLHSYATDAQGNIVGLSQDPDSRVWTAVEQQKAGDAVIDKPFQAADGALTLYDNLGAIYRTAPTSNLGLSVSGGSDRTQYLLSANRLQTAGIEEAVGWERNSVRLNLTNQLRDDLQVDARMNLIYSKNRGESIDGNTVESQLGAALIIPQFIDITERDAEGRYLLMQQAGQTANSPLGFKDINDRTSDLVRVLNSYTLNYRPLRFLELDYKLGIDHYRNQYEEVQDNVEQRPNNTPVLEKEGQVLYQNWRNTYLNSNASAYLRSDFRRDFGLELPILTQTQLTFDWRKNLFQRIESRGIGLPPLQGLRTLAATEEQTVDEFRETFLTYGVLANQKIEVGEWSGFSFGGRYDKSSAFGRGEDAEFFPRGDVYVRLSELFFPARVQNTFSEFKLRAAYGEAGTQPSAFDRIITLDQGLVGTAPFFNSQGTLSNPLLRVERSKEFEAGADLGFRFGQRWFPSAGLNFTYWDRSSEDAIDLIEIAPSTGAVRLNSNSYLIDAQGFDVGLQTLVFFSRGFSWNSSVNFGRQQSIVTDIANGEDFLLTVHSGQTFILREGETVGAHLGYRAVSSFDELRPDGTPYVPEADRAKFVMVDGHVVNQETKQVLFRTSQEVIGDPTPDFTLSFRNDFALARRLNVGIQFDWVQGPDIYNATKQSMYQYQTHRDVQEPVQIGTLEPKAWAAYYQSIYKTRDKNEFFVEDGSFVKLRELSISYDLAPLIRRVSPMNRLVLSFSGKNLLTFTKYSGFDPEVTTGNRVAEDSNVTSVPDDSRFRGYDYYTYPNFRTYTFGITASF